jgi:DNA-binding response OmpR family regulator
VRKRRTTAQVRGGSAENRRFPESRVRITPCSATAIVQNILVIEDETAVGEIVNRALQHEGFAVTHVESAAVGLALAREQPFTLAVVDVKLPDMDGLEFVRELRTKYPNVKVLFMSGYPHDYLLKNALGFDDEPFLQKPFSRAALVESVKSCLTSSAQ